MTIQTVFLDAGGVLVWPNWARVAEALRKQGVDVDPKQLAAADAVARYQLDVAHIVDGSTDQRRSTSFFDLVLIEVGVQPSAATAAALDDIRVYHDVENLWEVVPDFVVPTLKELREEGYKLVVVSNANGRLQHLLERLELAPFFDLMLDSKVEGVEKPDPRFFELALKRASASAKTTVHVGDFYNIDVVGARAAGISAILVDELDLHRDADCPRIRSIAELPRILRDRA